jgi:hypothetical protein
VDGDQSIQAVVTLGASTQVNESGITYQYVAVCDPAARFFVAQSDYQSTNSSTFPTAIPLQAGPEFLPEWAFGQGDGTNNTTTVSLYIKGPGHAATAFQLITNANPVANAWTFAAGLMVTESALWNALPTGANSFATLQARQDDGNGPFDIPPVVIATYTGDGTGARVIPLDLGGRRPLYALVASTDNTAGRKYLRDPSHTSTNSSNIGTSGATIGTGGITAGGIDEITVATNLNVNAVVYNVFALPGCVDAGEGGWSVQCELWPVEPDSMLEDDWFEPMEVDPSEPPPEEIGECGDPGGVGCVEPIVWSCEVEE